MSVKLENIDNAIEKIMTSIKKHGAEKNIVVNLTITIMDSPKFRNIKYTPKKYRGLDEDGSRE
jgi:hypothetical protein